MKIAKLVVASHNQGKIDEIKKSLEAYREKENKETHLDEIDQKKAAFLQMIAGYFAK